MLLNVHRSDGNLYDHAWRDRELLSYPTKKTN